MSAEQGQAWLIVNADDYGYFDCVSRGILDANQRGIVTATGIMANGSALDAHIDKLGAHEGLDLGIHLNLTHGEPLTKVMRKKLSRWQERFPDKFSMAMAILRSGISVGDVDSEWRAQIERCLTRNLHIRFLNSHEHIHMLPPLFSLTQELARRYKIPHVRFSAPERMRAWTPGGSFRGGIMAGLSLFNRRRSESRRVEFLGMGESGRLGSAYMQWKLPALQAGKIYELMCHPGYRDESETRDPRLHAYHDWEGELDLLTSPATRALLENHSVRLIGYRHLDSLAQDTGADGMPAGRTN